MLRRAVVLCGALAAACGGNAATTTPSAAATPSSPHPTAAASASPSSLALVGATKVTFVGSGTDPAGGSLSYGWSFGDGASASGQTVVHVFSREGTFNVVLTVTDNRGGTATAGVAVQARGLSGHWTPLQNGVPGIDATIIQAGAAITGQSTNSCCTHTFAGEVSDPRAISLVFHFSGCRTEERAFVGTVSGDLNTINLTGPNCNVPKTTYGFTRK